jgi:hypothetical protein
MDSRFISFPLWQAFASAEIGRKAGAAGATYLAVCRLRR